MSRKRRIAFVTGTRAEYGLLQLLMKEVAADVALELQIVVTGMHLSPEFGLTYREIEHDGFAIDAKVEMLLSSDSAVGTAKAMGVGTIGFADAFDRLKPDLLVVLGDRFEILAAAQAAVVCRIPVAHIHGGERTEGAFDDSFRHAITKMAQWHFVAAQEYRRRVIQLGEPPERVFDYGAPALDLLQHMQWLDRATLEKSLGIGLKEPVFLVTYHPVTLSQRPPVEAFEQLLAALDEFADATVIFTYPNSDALSRGLIDQLNRWVAANERRARAFKSLGQQRYSSLMRECDVLLGNSSSALIEAPALKKAAVNVGERQTGRLKASSVIDADEEQRAIVAAIAKALSPAFRATLSTTQSLYGTGNVARRIKDTLKAVELTSVKSFFDIDHGH